MADSNSDSLSYYYEKVNRLEYSIRTSELYRLERQAELSKMLESAPRTKERDYLRNMPFQCGIGNPKTTYGPEDVNVVQQSLNHNFGHQNFAPLNFSSLQPPLNSLNSLQYYPANSFSPVPGMFCNGNNCKYQSTARKGISVDKLSEAHKQLQMKTNELLRETQRMWKHVAKSKSHQWTQTDNELIIKPYERTTTASLSDNVPETNQSIDAGYAHPVTDRINGNVYNNRMESGEESDCPYCFHCAQIRCRQNPSFLNDGSHRKLTDTVRSRPMKDQRSVHLPASSGERKEPGSTKAGLLQSDPQKQVKSVLGNHRKNGTSSSNKVNGLQSHLKQIGHLGKCNDKLLPSPEKRRISPKHEMSAIVGKQEEEQVLSESNGKLVEDYKRETLSENSYDEEIESHAKVYFSNQHESSMNAGLSHHNGSSYAYESKNRKLLKEVENYGKTNQASGSKLEKSSLRRNSSSIGSMAKPIVDVALNDVDTTHSEGEILAEQVDVVDEESAGDANHSPRTNEHDEGQEDSMIETTSASELSNDGAEAIAVAEQLVEIDEFEDYEDVLKRERNNIDGGKEDQIDAEISLDSAPEPNLLIQSSNGEAPHEEQVTLSSETFQVLTVLFGCVESLSTSSSGYTDAYSGELADDHLWSKVSAEVFACEDAHQLNLEDVSRAALSQLEKIVVQLPERSLFPRKIISAKSPTSEEDIRDELKTEPYRLRLWDILTNHIGHFKRHNIMDTTTLIKIIAPLLLPAASTNEDLETCEYLLLYEFSTRPNSDEHLESGEAGDGSYSSDSVSHRIQAAMQKTGNSKSLMQTSGQDANILQKNASCSDSSSVRDDGDCLHPSHTDDELGHLETQQMSTLQNTQPYLVKQTHVEDDFAAGADEAEKLEAKMLRELVESDEESSEDSEYSDKDAAGDALPKNSGSRWAPVTLTSITGQEPPHELQKPLDRGNKTAAKATAEVTKKHFYLEQTKSTPQFSQSVWNKNVSEPQAGKMAKSKQRGKKPVWRDSSSSGDELGELRGLRSSKTPLLRQQSIHRSSSEMEEF